MWLSQVTTPNTLMWTGSSALNSYNSFSIHCAVCVWVYVSGGVYVSMCGGLHVHAWICVCVCTCVFFYYYVICCHLITLKSSYWRFRRECQSTQHSVFKLVEEEIASWCCFPHSPCPTDSKLLHNKEKMVTFFHSQYIYIYIYIYIYGSKVVPFVKTSLPMPITW